MRKSGSLGTLILMMLLLAVGVAAVLVVTYPSLQGEFKIFLENLWTGICNFFAPFFDHFRRAFVRG